MTEYKGIDYGMGQANVDRATGIRYGVINQNELLQAWADSSEPYYPCDECEVERDILGGLIDGACDSCEPSSYYIDDKEYQAECGEDGDIFITKSPYYTYAQFCSPCAPGACYLTNPCTGGEKAYCFGHDWFSDQGDGRKAPYSIYRVTDNIQV